MPSLVKCVAVREGDIVYMQMSLESASAICTLVGKVSLGTNEFTSPVYRALSPITKKYTFINKVPTIQLSDKECKDDD